MTSCLRQIGLTLRRLGLLRPAVSRHMTAAMSGTSNRELRASVYVESESGGRDKQVGTRMHII